LSERESDYTMKHSEEEVMRLELQAIALSDIIDQEIDALDIKSGMAILDAGCGTGAISRRFAQIVKPAKVTAIDFDPLFLDTARAIAVDEGIENPINLVSNIFMVTNNSTVNKDTINKA